MGWATAIALYFTLWWVMLFAVLPLGVKRVEDGAPGIDRGAPQTPRIWWKAGVTCVVAFFVWLPIYLLWGSPWAQRVIWGD